MNFREFFRKKFRFNIYFWLVILLACIIAVEGYAVPGFRFPSIVYFVALWLSLPLQILFLFWFFNRDESTYTDAIIVFLISFVTVQFFTNPYLPTSLLWYISMQVDYISGPVILVWSGFWLYNQRLAEA